MAGCKTQRAIRPRKSDSIRILVMDDVGAGVKDSPFVTSRLERLFSTRYQLRLPTAISTNLSWSRFETTVGKRVVSRFSDTSLASIIELHECADARPYLEDFYV
jgi:DNA replication protein DnaC